MIRISRNYIIFFIGLMFISLTSNIAEAKNDTLNRYLANQYGAGVQYDKHGNHKLVEKVRNAYAIFQKPIPANLDKYLRALSLIAYGEFELRHLTPSARHTLSLGGSYDALKIKRQEQALIIKVVSIASPIISQYEAYLAKPQEPIQEFITINATDIRIIDGDTVQVGQHIIRLIGFDTPETHRPRCVSELNRGKKATRRLRSFIKEAQFAKFLFNQSKDQYGRLLAKMYLNNRDAADIMVSAGLAKRYNGGLRESWC